MIHAGFGILQTPENQAKFATGTGICTFGGSENMEGEKAKNRCNPDTFHPE